MIASMTGFGRAEVTRNGITASVEVRSVNSRYLEITTRLPRPLAQREMDLKEVIRSRVNRGNLTVSISLEDESNSTAPLSVNTAAAKSYMKLLNQLRKTTKIQEKVKLEHLLKFSEIFEVQKEEEDDNEQWLIIVEAVEAALSDLNTMRRNEGKELAKDLTKRINRINETVEKIEELSKQRIPEERARLYERIGQLLEDKTVLDQNRLELEIALLSDKLDVTEECVRFRSHNKFFLTAMEDNEPAGRKLNFLVQEINREVNTIGSKTSDAELAHLVVGIKEELEKIREQLQNIE
ncbi:MAG: YicC/YloC family endoribonuclease [bacterium]